MPAGPPSPLEATLVDAALQSARPEYKAWRAKYPKISASNDYDVYKAYEVGAVPDPQTGHLDDIGKLPNHMTYSKDSWYAQQPHQPTAGEWKSDPAGKSWAFHASDWNLSNAGGKPALKAYFDKIEPGNTIVFPDGEVYTSPAQGPAR